MRPIIKKKRRDPRYFLHEGLEEGIQYRLKVSEKLVEPEEDEEGEDKDHDLETPGKQELLKGEKSLYEKIRAAVEEAYDTSLKEENLEEMTRGGGN